MGKAVSNTGEERLYHYDANGNVDSVTTVCDRNKQTTVYTFRSEEWMKAVSQVSKRVKRGNVRYLVAVEMQSGQSGKRGKRGDI